MTVRSHLEETMFIVDKSHIGEREGVYRLQSGVEIYARTLFSTQGREGKTAIFIHGGGSGGNHTIVYRPSCWLINRGAFSSVILPDRRGAGRSSPITSVMTYEENALDMRGLLDAMGISGKVTAIGVSYGGPIALTLAAIDSRVDEVMLVASSPSLRPARGLAGFLYRRGLLERLVKSVYSKSIGTMETAYPDFDGAYDASGVSGLKKLFMDAIRRIDRSRLNSLLLENASTCALQNAAVDARLHVGVPVYRVIGTRDETWEVDTASRYDGQIPLMKSAYIPGAGHKDVFFRAEAFYTALCELEGC